MKIIFKNMESSENVKAVIVERMSHILEKYPSARDHRITFTLEMENSPFQAGPDRFNASALISGKVFKLRIKRSSQNLYQSIADLAEGFNQLMSREADRVLKLQQRSEKIAS